MTDIIRHFIDTIEWCKQDFFPLDREISFYIFDNDNKGLKSPFPNDEVEILATIFITPHWWGIC